MQRKILVVEDNEISREMLVSILQNDYEVLEAHDGIQALSVLEKEKESISAVMLDLIMPRINGFELLEKIKQTPEFEKIPVLVVTEKRNADTEAMILEAGAIDYITKPYHEKVLRTRLHNVIRAGEQSDASMRETLLKDQLRVILSDMSGGLSACQYDKDGVKRVIFANDSFYEQRGYTKAQYEEEVHSILDIVHPDDVAGTKEKDQKAIETGGAHEGNYRIIKRDGTIAWIHGKVSITKFDGMEIPLLLSITDDITSEYEQNESIRQSKMFLDTVLSNIAGGITAVTVKENRVEYLYSNDQFYKMLKYTREQFQPVWQNLSSIFHPDDRDRVRTAVSNLLPGEPPLTLEYKAICQDASVIKVRMLVVSLRYNEMDEPIQVSIFEDITEESKESDRQKELIDNLPCGAGIFEVEGDQLTCVYLNEKFWKLIGRRPGQNPDRGTFDYILEKDHQCLKDQMKKIVDTGEEQECEIHILHGEGYYLPFVVRGNIIKRKSGKLTLYATYTSIGEEVVTFRQMLPVALETMMSSTMDLAFIKDKSLHYVCASHVFAQMLNIDDEKEVRGKTDYDLFDKRLADQYYNEDLKLLENGEALIDQVERLPVMNGFIRYASVSKYLLKDAYGNIIGIYGTGRDITDNREALKRLQLLTNTIPGGLATYEIMQDGIRTLYLTEGVYGITGYDKEDYDIAHNNPFTIVAEEDREQLQSQIYMMIRNGTELNTNIRIVRKDGTKRWINVRGTETERRNNRLMVNVVLFDVHEQKLAEFKNRQAEFETQKRYQYELQLRKKLIMNSIYYYQVNLNDDIIEEYEAQDHNISYMKSGIRFSYVTKQYISAEILPEDLEKVKDRLFLRGLRSAFRKGEKAFSLSYRRKLFDNEYHWVMMDVILIEKVPEGVPIAFLACRDIDREKKDQLAIATLLNKDIEAIFHIHTKSGIAYIAHMVESANYNKVYDQFLFEQKSENACRNVVFEEDRDHYLKFCKIANLKELLEYDTIATLHYRVVEHGEVQWKYANAYYMDERKEVIVLTRRDVTKNSVEEQNQKKVLQAAVELANEANQAKSEFLSRMSHDIRTPLNAVLAFSNDELLAGADRDTLREYLRKVNMSGEYLLGIINDVLDMSRIEQKCIKLNPEPYYLLDFEKTMHNVIDELSKNRNIKFSMDTSKSGVNGIIVDHVRFNQIFINLLSNSVKFTPRGGKVELIIKELKQKKNDRVLKRFIVRDNGIGMSKEFIPHAFESFNQEYRKDTSERNQGTGLGLSIVKELVKMMGGTIKLQSELNKGTTFTIDLPIEGIELSQHVEKTQLHDYSIMQGKRILLGEDNDINTEIAKALLEKHGCIVERAANGKETCQLFSKAEVGYYHLILMDIRMPVMDGISATRKIREMDRPDAKLIPIIAMTADAFSEDERVAYEAGMNAHLAKPIDPEKLYGTCCEFIGKSSL